mmetsp:Transcript_32680/g.47304  ORF Transcript_32680/g.47304 Transcript_32680/m.47304 type:complete len:243 (-) Transcript_32680:19-747(-)
MLCFSDVNAHRTRKLQQLIIVVVVFLMSNNNGTNSTAFACTCFLTTSPPTTMKSNNNHKILASRSTSRRSLNVVANDDDSPSSAAAKKRFNDDNDNDNDYGTCCSNPSTILSNNTTTTPRNKKMKQKKKFQTFDEMLSIYSDRPLLVGFQARWCGPCKLLDVELRQAIDMHSHSCTSNGDNVNGDIICMLKVDAEKFPSIAQRFDIEALPVAILFVKGQPVHKFEGVLSAETILEELSQHIT